MEVLRENTSHASLLASSGCQRSLAVIDISLQSLPPCSHGIFPLCLSVSTPLLYGHQSLGWGPTLIQFDLILTWLQPYFQIRSYLQALGIKTWTYLLGSYNSEALSKDPFYCSECLVWMINFIAAKHLDSHSLPIVLSTCRTRKEWFLGFYLDESAPTSGTFLSDISRSVLSLNLWPLRPLLTPFAIVLALLVQLSGHAHTATHSQIELPAIFMQINLLNATFV